MSYIQPYYGSDSAGNNAPPEFTAQKLKEIFEDLASYSFEKENEAGEEFVLNSLERTKRLIGRDISLVDSDVIHAIGTLVREGKTPAIRVKAIGNLSANRFDKTSQCKILDELFMALKQTGSADANAVGLAVMHNIDTTTAYLGPEGRETIAEIRDFLEEFMVAHPDPVLRTRGISLYTRFAVDTHAKGEYPYKTIQDNLLLSATNDPSAEVRCGAIRCLESLYGHARSGAPLAMKLENEKKVVSAEVLDTALLSMMNDPDSRVRRDAVVLAHAVLPFTKGPWADRMYEAMTKLAENESDWDVLEAAASVVQGLERSSRWEDIRLHADGLYKAFSRAAQQAGSEQERICSRSKSFVATLRVRQQVAIELALDRAAPPPPKHDLPR